MLKSAIVITFFAVQAAKKPEIIDKQSENHHNYDLDSKLTLL